MGQEGKKGRRERREGGTVKRKEGKRKRGGGGGGEKSGGEEDGKHLMGLSSTVLCCTQVLSCDAPQTHNVVSSLEEGEHAGDNSSHSGREQEGACCPFQSCNSVSCSIHSGVAPATVQVASLKSGNMPDTD